MLYWLLNKWLGFVLCLRLCTIVVTHNPLPVTKSATGARLAKLL